MNTEMKLPDGLQLAVDIIASTLAGPNARSAATAAIRAERAQRVSMQQRVADLERHTANLVAEADAQILAMQAAFQERLTLDRTNRDLAVRIAELEAERDKAHQDAISAAVERDELHARLAELEGQEPVAISKAGNLFWAGNPQDHRGVDCGLYARPVPAIPADPGMLTVSMAPSSAYAMGWNDCRVKMLTAAPEAAR